MDLQRLDTCYEEDESYVTTARNVTNSKTIEEHTNHIKNKLQTVLDQCIEEQNRSSEGELKTTE